MCRYPDTLVTAKILYPCYCGRFTSTAAYRCATALMYVNMQCNIMCNTRSLDRDRHTMFSVVTFSQHKRNVSAIPKGTQEMSKVALRKTRVFTMFTFAVWKMRMASDGTAPRIIVISSYLRNTF